MTIDELEEWLSAPSRKLWTATVSDNCGDYGLVGIVSVEINSEDSRICDLILSCRVFGRSVEALLLFTAIEYSESKHVKNVCATLIPTDKNIPCQDFMHLSGMIEISKNQFVWHLNKKFNIDTYTRISKKEKCSKFKYAGNNKLQNITEYLATKKCSPILTNTFESRIRGIDCSTEVYIPGGNFVPGSTSEEVQLLESVFGYSPSGELNRDSVQIKPFWLDKYCVTQMMLCKYLNDAITVDDRLSVVEFLNSLSRDCKLAYDQALREIRPSTGAEKLPAVVPAEYAHSYASWADARLPTEDEWEFSVRGSDGRWFPWGNSMPVDIPCLQGLDRTIDVDMFVENISPFGIVGAIGNVWQWCEGDYRGHPPYRGGDYKLGLNLYYLRAALQPLNNAVECGWSVGFRLARDL